MSEELDLSAMRQEIEQVDAQFIELLGRRMVAVRKVGELKKRNQKDVWDPERERLLLAKWDEIAQENGVSSLFASRVLREILDHSRRCQEFVLDGAAGAKKKAKIGYQGAPHCNSDLAIRKHFEVDQEDFHSVAYDRFDHVFDAVEAGNIEYGMVPVENTLIGGITAVNRLLTERNIAIVGEETWEVVHCVATLPGVTETEVEEIRSHEAALAQCADYLKSLPSVRVRNHVDTAGSAIELSETQERGVAVLCPPDAARANGLKILRDNVADSPGCMTRFVLIAKEQRTSASSLPSKTTLVVHAAHRPGALFRVLSCFASAEVDLCRIESRPAPGSPWEYVFLIDIEGHIESTRVARAVASARTHCNQFRVLGSYPSRTVGAPTVDLLASERKFEVNEVEAPRIEVSGPPLARLNQENDRSIVYVDGVAIGGSEFAIIAGPCAVETREQIHTAAKLVKERGAQILRGGAFKPRSSVYSFQGLGFEGLDLLAEAGQDCELPIVTEVLIPDAIEPIAAKASMLQVGARNMQNFELLKELGRCNKPVLLKRGMSATIGELLEASEYIMAGGNNQVVLCERGIRTFETATRNTLDVSAIPVLKSRTHLPVIVDPSHAAGRRDLVLPLACAAVSAGADGIIVEVHPNPDEALCDKDQALTPDLFSTLIHKIRAIRGAMV